MMIKAKLLEAAATAREQEIADFVTYFKAELEWLKEELINAASEGNYRFVLSRELATKYFSIYNGELLHISQLHHYLSSYFEDITVYYGEFYVSYGSNIIQDIIFSWDRKNEQN